MLDTCHKIACYVSLSFNVSNVDAWLLVKCVKLLSSLYISVIYKYSGVTIKYLGVYVVNCKHVKLDINPVKRSFHAACNSVFSHSHGTSEIAILTRNI